MKNRRILPMVHVEHYLAAEVHLYPRRSEAARCFITDFTISVCLPS